MKIVLKPLLYNERVGGGGIMMHIQIYRRCMLFYIFLDSISGQGSSVHMNLLLWYQVPQAIFLLKCYLK